MPSAMRWMMIGVNVVLLFSEAVVFLDRGVGLVPMEIALTSLFVATPLVTLAVFLDYNRREV